MHPASARLFLGLALTAPLLGCARTAPGPALAEPYPVHGTIAFPGGTPLRGGIVYFTPDEISANGLIRYEVAGLVDARGHYKAGFNGDGSGAAAGEYTVTIQPRDYQELRPSNSDRIPERYRERATTPLKVTVKEGDNQFDFVLR